MELESIKSVGFLNVNLSPYLRNSHQDERANLKPYLLHSDSDWGPWEDTEIVKVLREYILVLSDASWNDCLCPPVEFLKIEKLFDKFISEIFFDFSLIKMSENRKVGEIYSEVSVPVLSVFSNVILWTYFDHTCFPG